MSDLVHQIDQTRYQLPPGGKWFYTQQPMLEAYYSTLASTDPNALAVAWDKPGSGTKIYGLYHSMPRETFMLNLLDTATQNRHCYELLAEDSPCKGYADVEWEGPDDPGHTTLTRLVKAIRQKVKDHFTLDPKIYVCCGTRPTKEDPAVLKHSYHIVLDNVIFERNNDGQMKQFFTTIQGFTWMDGVEEKPMVDPRVYTKNRVFRLPHCTKIGGTVPFLRISGDPHRDDDFGTTDFGRDPKAVLPFFITAHGHASSDGQYKFVRTPPLVLEKAAVGGGRKRNRAVDAPQGHTSGRVLPVPMPILQHILALSGDTVSKLVSIQYLPQEDQWQVQGDQRAQGRTCLAHAGTIHDSNNAILFVDRVPTGFRVHYQCMSTGCASIHPKPILGYISMNTQTFEWQIALSPKPPDAQQQDDGEPMITEEQQQQQQESDYEMPDEMSDEPTNEQAREMACIGEDSSSDEEEEAMEEDDSPGPGIQLVEPPHDTDNPALNTYEMVKERFERNCFYVNNKNMYLKLNKGPGDFSILSHTQILHAYCALTYWGPMGDKGDIVEQLFIRKWILDKNKKFVEKIDIDPRGTEPDVYNLWRGFTAAELPPVPDEHVLELIQPITRHFDEVITSGVAAHTQFIHAYLANIIQRPWQKTQVALSLYGSQGCGKGIVFEFFRLKVLGTHCSYQTSKPENDLFGRFANGAVNRVCVQVDEVKSLHEHADQLKDFITNPTVNYEMKGKDTIVVNNFANLILTSNNANALTVSTDDRRFALFQCTSVHKGDTQYFSELGAHLERPEVARAYYQYLMGVDLSEYPTSFQHKRPVTEYYKEVQHNSIPVFARFMSSLVNSEHSATEINARDLYAKYELFRTKGNYKFVMTETSFGREVKKVAGVTSKKTNTVRVYQLDHEAIKAHLQASNEYDPDAENYQL